ncbi:hypothetical protein ACS0TY_002241 [Phlomoides rotata]
MLGANKCVYAPAEPIDVGRVLQADIATSGLKDTLTTDGHIEQDIDRDPAASVTATKPFSLNVPTNFIHVP